MHGCTDFQEEYTDMQLDFVLSQVSQEKRQESETEKTNEGADMLE